MTMKNLLLLLIRNENFLKFLIFFIALSLSLARSILSLASCFDETDFSIENKILISLLEIRNNIINYYYYHHCYYSYYYDAVVADIVS